MAHIPGEGLAKGLAVTLRHMLRKSETQQYPEVKPDLPPRSRGVIALVEENCTVCMLCARECPDWCIYIDSHKETLPAPEGGRPRARNVLDRFAIDFSLCMYCGICIEVCPFDALFWSPEFEYAEYDIRDLIHEKDTLGEWAATVPPPPPHEVGAEPPKKIVAASRPARPAATPPGPARTASRPEAGPGAGATAGAAAGAGSATGDAAVTAPGGANPAGTGERGAAGTSEAGARPGGAPSPQRTEGGASSPERATGGASSPEQAPGGAAPRRPARPMRDIRSIRPPGSLPKRSAGGTDEPRDAKDGPEEDA
ncbi:NuoI/complex I 23 kDa subunit family protein [Microbispora sp. ATCC PTA-5024]|uniref:NuoI/complex I 23 kDa subunit family protein n=1 Tax=Microbispora sp. ATCC PTA-5024 TaxID=316330 RepID=UPI00041076E6|nr:4Fe-4S binding protein [Microbispora sp. ATCC PTA-5024]